MNPPENLDERLARLRTATDLTSAPPFFEERVLAALKTSSRWEVALTWCRRALLVSAFATVSVVGLALWHDARLINRVAVAGLADDGSTSDP